MNVLTPFADLTAGIRFRSSGRTLTETDLTMFCMLTGDRHPIHADSEYCRTTQFGQRLFHGTFGIALAIAMTTELPALAEPVIAATGLREWRFKGPLLIGDTVHVEVEVVATSVAGQGKRGIVERRLQLIKQDGSVAQEGFAGLMVRLAGSPN